MKDFEYTREELDAMWQDIDCRKLLTHASHDLRSSLNNVLGLTELAKHQVDDREYVAYCLDKIDDSAHYLLNLLNDILYTITPQEKSAVLRQDSFNLRELFDNLCSGIRTSIQDKRINFVSCMDDDVVHHVVSDRGRVRQIIQNLLSNAVKFTPRYGRVEFFIHQLAREEDRVSLEFVVRDTGIGIKEELQDKIFLPMTRENEDAVIAYGGTGLGLALCKRLTDWLGGRLEFKSTKDYGSDFRLYLDFEIDADAERQSKGQQAEGYGFAGRTVLLAEDNAINSEIVKRLLSSRGVVVDTAENGRIAMNKFMMNAPGTYDLILMDVKMPLMDGLEAAGRIRASGKSDAKKIPIVAMTANAYDKDVQQSMDAGMNAHLAKPVETAELYEIMLKAVAGEL